MIKILLFVLCFVLTAFAVYISGFPNLVNDVPEGLAVPSFIGASLLLSVIVFAVALMYLKIRELSERLSRLEEERFEDRSDTDNS